jgi:Amt family ammonium transporter
LVEVEVDIGATLLLLLGGFLVFLMVPAIGMLEAGLIRRRNIVNGLMKGLMAVAVFLPIWFLVFPINFYPVISGTYPGGFYMTGESRGVPDLVYSFFIGVFGAVTLALIFAGAPERIRFGGWLLYAVFFSAIQWPLIAGWIWGGGWLSNLGSITGWAPGLGVRDFAGGTVVHAYAGIATLAILMVVGPTLRRALPNSETRSEYIYMRYVQKIEAQNIELPLAMLGTALLWFGWYGFNGCSTVTITQQTGYAVANTAIAASLGGVVSALISKVSEGVWNPVMTISGIIGGLVAITPLAGFVDLYSGFLVGFTAGVISYYGIRGVERWVIIDDPVGSFPVHGFNGIMGSALVPVLSNPSVGGLQGIVYGGSPGWLATQLLGMGIALTLVFVTTYIFFKALVALRLRARPEEELVGLDIVDHDVRLG